ncbi:MAG: ParB/RepB/Spo0J family partition protein [Aureliella sp.]
MLVERISLVDLIIDDNWNCRSSFYPLSYEELAESLKHYGQLMPVLVVRDGARYRLVAGFRRCRAAKLIDWTHIYARVSDLSPEVCRRVNICENIERKELSLWEEAVAIRSLYRDEDAAFKIANELKRPIKWVKRRLRLLQLEEEIQRAADSGRITEGDLERLANLTTSRARMDLLRKLLSEMVATPIAKTTTRSPTAIRDMTVKLLSMGVEGLPLDVLLWVEKQLTDEELIARAGGNDGVPEIRVEPADQ